MSNLPKVCRGRLKPRSWPASLGSQSPTIPHCTDWNRLEYVFFPNLRAKQ